jgi:hypothetical protein
MRWLIVATILSCALSLPGCAAGDMLYSLFGARDSNQADLNSGNRKNSGADMFGN